MGDKPQNRTCQYKHWYKNANLPVYKCHEPVEDGQEFCVCHRRERTPEELDKLEKIIRKRMAAKNYDFVGLFFPKEFSFGDKVLFEGEADFSGSTFEGDMSFKDVTFEGRVKFRRATFKSEAKFMDATFERGAEFWHATFEGDASFRRATFKDDTWFDDVTFKSMAKFRLAVFGDSCYFLGAAFGGETNFSAVSLPQAGEFRKAKKMRRRIKPGRGESFCRFAKQVLQNMGHYPEAGDYHYEERRQSWYATRERRKQGAEVWLRKRWPAKAGTAASRLARVWAGMLGFPHRLLLRWVFGYAERPGRIAAIGVAVICFCALLYYDYGAIVESQTASVPTGFGEYLYFSTVAFTTLGFGDFRPVASTYWRLIAAGEALTGAFLMAAFLVTLARRWGRG